MTKTENIKISKLAFFAGLSVFFLFFACKKNEIGKTIEGPYTLYVRTVHHSWYTTGLPVYIKYTNSGFPGKDSSVYEQKVNTNEDGQAAFTKLFAGKYWIYASGYDSTVAAHVLGYDSVSINNSTLQNNSLTVTLYVSE